MGDYVLGDVGGDGHRPTGSRSGKEAALTTGTGHRCQAIPPFRPRRQMAGPGHSGFAGLQICVEKLGPAQRAAQEFMTTPIA